MTIENIPSDIISRYFPLNLNAKNLSAITQSSKTLHTLFKPALTASKLLYCVINAYWEEAKNIITDHPMLMFQPVLLPNESAAISPLKWAFQILDSYMWQIFFERIKDNSEWLLLFYNQRLAQTTYIDLEYIFSKYKDHISLCKQTIVCSYYTNVAKLQKSLSELGKLQSQLPIHFLKMLCGAHSWINISPDFSIAKNALPLSITLFSRHRNEELLIKDILPQLGTEQEVLSFVQTYQPLLASHKTIILTAISTMI
jgi:hypothetical protein